MGLRIGEVVRAHSLRCIAASETIQMPHTHRLFRSIDDVDLATWEHVRVKSGSSIFMDPRFIAAVEFSLKRTCQFWYVIIHDETGQPVACACLTGMTIDLADFADPRLASMLRCMPRPLSKFRKLRILMCGLPGSPGEKNLAFTTRNAEPQIVSLLDRAVCELAAKESTNGIIYKEFGEDDLEWTNSLSELGYRRFAIPSMHFFQPSFDNFPQYCAALKTRYRQQITRSTRKLEGTGVSLSVLTDPQAILDAYTPEVHALYDATVARAEVKLEVVPIEYFHELTRRLEGLVDLIVFSEGSRIIAFGWCLHSGSDYHMLYAGFDHRLNDKLDLYFNLMYAGLDRALRKRASKIHVGQGADSFKSRIGCYSEPLYVFAKGLGPLMSRVVHYGADWLVAQKPTMLPANIFKSGVVESLKRADHTSA